MKSSVLLVAAPLLPLLLFSISVATAQQAPVYVQHQYVNPAPVYRQAPTYGQPQRYAQPSYPQQNYQGYNQPSQSQYVSPAEFLPNFGRKFGNLFRRVFYGDSSPTGYSPQAYPPTGRLDHPPQGYVRDPEIAPSSPITPPRYETPPPPTTKIQPKVKSTPPSTSKSVNQSKKPSSTKTSNSSSSATRKYTPPSITRQTSKPLVEEEPLPVVEKDNTPIDPPSQLPGSKPKDQVKSSTNTTAAANNGNFLRGKKGSKDGRVISPYPPYRELDVSGLSSGSLALDPTTQKVFEVP
jgi:hypothetical protein